MPNYGLAPMEGVGDFPTRLWFALTSAPAFCGTPFFRVTATHPGGDMVDEHTWPELGFAKSYVRYRLVPQLMAANTEDFVRVAENILKKNEQVELNCGCPSPKVVGNGAGSSILVRPGVFGERIRTIVDRLGPKRLSVKMRLGFHDQGEFGELFSQIAGLYLARVVVHGRTRAQSYRGKANWQKIAWASEHADFDVWGSGDIGSASCAQKAEKEAPRVRTMIVGRGALRNPWIFADLRGKSVRVNRNVVVLSLASFALLQFAYRKENFSKLKDLVMDGIFADTCEDSVEKWQHVYNALSERIFSRFISPTELTFDSKVLGRTKMIWHYLRSSLNAEAMYAPVLRSKSIGEFFGEIEKCVSQNTFSLQYRPEHDWIYAGEKRPQSS